MISSENQTVRFRSFVVTVFWNSTSYTVIIVFWMNDVIGACYCTCSLVALRVPEVCFWPAKTRKNLNFSRCIHVFDLVLEYCSDLNERNWQQLLFYFIVLMASCLGYWIGFLSSVFWVSDWRFLVLHFRGNVCKWIPNMIWSQMDWFLFFLLLYASFRQFHV